MNNNFDQSYFETDISGRQKKNRYFILLFIVASATGIIFLFILLFSIVNNAFGMTALKYEKNPEAFPELNINMKESTRNELITFLTGNVSKGLIRKLEHEKPLIKRNKNEIINLIHDEIFRIRVVKSWPLSDLLINKKKIEEFIKENPGTKLEFKSWINADFIKNTQSSLPEKAGVKTALLGTIWLVLLTVLFAFPIGVATAVYLEEYAKDNFFTRIVQLNIFNLAGVPSIIFGILGLTVFVRFLSPLTSGAIFGLDGSSGSTGRTILSAGITLSLLTLPVIIINAQEAIRAVPSSLRSSSYGLGATKLQTIIHHVLPACFDRILTGTILAISRAVGETAPLVVVGASTFITVNPSTIFSKFTALPIQIYQWTSRPQQEFRNTAAAAIIVLLLLLLSMNTTAVILRNRIRRNREA